MIESPLPARRMTRWFQFSAIRRARKTTLAWTKAQGIPLHRIEFIVPFVQGDFSLDVWLFFETNDSLAEVREDGRYAAVERTFTEALAATGYAPEWLAKVVFYSDSHENVERHYEGSYFYRLR